MIEKLTVLPSENILSHKIIDLLQEKIPDFPWRSIKDFRNFIVHEYFGVDAKIVWDLSTIELDGLKKRLLDFRDLQI